jgi:hypothetical protein
MPRPRREWALPLQLDDVVRPSPQVVLGGYGSTALRYATLVPRRRARARNPSLREPAVEDDADVGIILESLDKMAIEPWVTPRHDEHMLHVEAIVRRSPVPHDLNSSAAQQVPRHRDGPRTARCRSEDGLTSELSAHRHFLDIGLARPRTRGERSARFARIASAGRRARHARGAADSWNRWVFRLA